MRTLAPLAMSAYMVSSQHPHAQPDDSSSSSRKRKRASTTATPPPPPSSLSSASSPAPIKRSRASVSLSPIERRQQYLSQLAECTPFRVAYREVSKGQREGTSPSQLVKVWLVGLNVDRAALTLRKKDGLRVLLHYRNSAHQLLTRHDATSSSVLATFLYHVATHEITRQQLDAWFTTHSLPDTSPPPSLAQLVSRFEMMSGLEKLIYSNCYKQHALLTDLLSRGMRVKLRDDIPDLSKRNKMLRPMRDGGVKVDGEAGQQRGEAAEEAKDDGDGAPDKDKKKSRRAAKRERVAQRQQQQQQQQSAAVAEVAERKIGADESSDTDEDDDDGSPADGSLDSASASADMSAPPVTPFSRYSHVVVWWSSQPQPAASPQSPSHERLLQLMAALMGSSPLVGVWEMSGEEVDVETVLTRLHVRILAALSAPVITAATPQQRVADILSHISSAQSATSSAPLPLRVEDACLVIVDRAYFERTVWPLIATPASVYELTEDSPVMEYADARVQVGGVKAERSADASEAQQSTSLTPAQQKEEERTATLSRRLVNEHIRRLCAPSPFLIYHLTSALPSLFFPPTPNKLLWSIASGVELTRPLVLEWPLHLPFDAAVVMLCCQWQLTVTQASGGRAGEVLVIVPCRCWRRRGVRDMRTELAEADMRGRLYGRDRGGRHHRAGNVVELRGVAVSMRPSPLPMERRMVVSDDAHYFVLQLSIRPPTATVDRAAYAQSNIIAPSTAPSPPPFTPSPVDSAPPSSAHPHTAPSPAASSAQAPSVANHALVSAPHTPTPQPVSSNGSSSSSSSSHPLDTSRFSQLTSPPPSHRPAARSASLLSSPPPLQADPLALQPAHRTRSKTTLSPHGGGGGGGGGGWVSVSGSGAPLTAHNGSNGQSVPALGYSRGGSGMGEAHGGQIGQRLNAASRVRGRSGSGGGLNAAIAAFAPSRVNGHGRSV